MTVGVLGIIGGVDAFHHCPSGLRIKSAMTGPGLVLSCSPSPLIPLPSRERGYFGWFGLVHPHVRRPSGLRIKSAMTGASCPGVPALWIPAYAGMTVRDAGMTGRSGDV